MDGLLLRIFIFLFCFYCEEQKKLKKKKSVRDMVFGSSRKLQEIDKKKEK